MAASKMSILDFPEELILSIFEFVPAADCPAVKRTCRMFNRIGSDVYTVLRADMGNPLKIMPKFRAASITHVTLRGSNINDSVLSVFSSLAPNLVALRFTCCPNLDKEALRTVVMKSRRLTSLEVDNCIHIDGSALDKAVGARPIAVSLVSCRNASEYKKGSYVLLEKSQVRGAAVKTVDGEGTHVACKVMEASVSKTGKHGMAKSRLRTMCLLSGAMGDAIMPARTQLASFTIRRWKVELYGVVSDNILLVSSNSVAGYEEIALARDDEKYPVLMTLADDLDHGRTQDQIYLELFTLSCDAEAIVHLQGFTVLPAPAPVSAGAAAACASAAAMPLESPYCAGAVYHPATGAGAGVAAFVGAGAGAAVAPAYLGAGAGAAATFPAYMYTATAGLMQPGSPMVGLVGAGAGAAAAY